IAEHVLEELLTDEHRTHQGAEHDDSSYRGHPEHPTPSNVQVVQRMVCPPLADDECNRRRDRYRSQPERHRSFVRDWRKIDGKQKRSDEQDGKNAAEFVYGVVRLVDMARHHGDREYQRDDRKWEREQKDRPPPVAL